ncbi:LuxR C-terminal-related transcriptional regulator [Dyadobacter frigoris]|uniref:HTH luxR-type domain-containing protein n=1 Tax=Dyadobacter frigoris TaxID=2576211 RepID=A0A4U6D2B1_9BACT|nr:hypothetical protein FDK13_17205 [Dyadobacter frigoris]
MKNTFPENNFPISLQDDCFYSITKREWDVLLLLTEDLSNQEIADGLHLCRNTVKHIEEGSLKNSKFQEKINLLVFPGKTRLGLKISIFNFIHPTNQ